MALDESNIDPEVTYSDSNVTSTPTGRRLSSATVVLALTPHIHIFCNLFFIEI
jgi:hypothetical protein